MRPIDKIVHEPVRLQIMTLLSGVEWADFASLCLTLGLTRGNLSAHSSRLEGCGYVRIKKSIIGRIPHTQYRLTARGRKALAQYWATIDQVRRLGQADLPEKT